MPASFGNLSTELINSVLKLVPAHSLPSVSLVCHTWHAISFPLLYHSLSLGGNHAEAFVQRVLNEPDNTEENGGNEAGGALRVASCVRRLRVDLQLDDEGLSNLGKALLKMKNLEHLHWGTVWVDSLDWHAVLVLLHESLPGLRSLSLDLTGLEFSLVRCVIWFDLY